MKVDRICPMGLTFSYVSYERDAQTNDVRYIISDDARIDEKMDETMQYLNALSDEKKCDISVKLDYNPSTKNGEILGEIKDRENKKPTRHVKVMIDSQNKNSVVSHIEQFKNDCRAIIQS